jgi:hypothetical protein
MKIKTEIEIDKELYYNSIDKLDMTLSEFVEYSLNMLIYNDDKYSKLFQKGCKSYKELLNFRNKLYSLEEKNKKNKSNKENYDMAMISIQRMHDKLGYIGKNQIREIANRNDLNHNDLMNYIKRNTSYEIRNFGGLPR